MRNFIFLLLFILANKALSQTIITCPENKEVDVLIDKAIAANKTGDSKTTITTFQKAIRLSKTAACLRGELVCNKNLMLVYGRLSEYKKALEISKEVERLALKLKDYKNLVTLYQTRATLYDYLGLYDESIKEYETALKYARLIEKADERHFDLSLTYYNLATYYQEISLQKCIESLKESKAEIEKIKENSTEISVVQKRNMQASIAMNLGTYYTIKENTDRDINLAESYFMEALQYAENDTYQVNIDTKICLYQALLEFYNGKKEYKKAINYGERMLEIEKSYSMPYNRRVGYMVLAKAYLGTGQNETSQKHLNLYSKLNDSINTVEKQAVEQPIKQIVSKNEKDYSQKLKKTVLIAGISMIILIIIGFITWNYKKKLLHKRYDGVINTLKSNALNYKEHQGIEIIKPDELETVILKPINIADETLASLLNKLEKFEKSNKFTKEDVNFSYLINYLGTNSKYLNEILKKHKGKSFSQYINDLRIDYIMRLLYEEPKYRAYKISYLAEVCGFSSREVFTITFKKKTGISPSYFIENLQTEMNS